MVSGTARWLSAATCARTLSRRSSAGPTKATSDHDGTQPTLLTFIFCYSTQVKARPQRSQKGLDGGAYRRPWLGLQGLKEELLNTRSLKLNNGTKMQLGVAQATSNRHQRALKGSTRHKRGPQGPAPRPPKGPEEPQRIAARRTQKRHKGLQREVSRIRNDRPLG